MLKRYISLHVVYIQYSDIELIFIIRLDINFIPKSFALYVVNKVRPCMYVSLLLRVAIDNDL